MLGERGPKHLDGRAGLDYTPIAEHDIETAYAIAPEGPEGVFDDRRSGGGSRPEDNYVVACVAMWQHHT